MQIRFAQRLKTSIDQRFRLHSDKSLHDYVYANHLFHAYDDSFFEFSISNRQLLSACLSDENVLDELTDYCVYSIKKYTNRKNQFINYSGYFNNVLRAIYRDFLLLIRDVVRESRSVREISHAFDSISKLHHNRLKLTLESYCETIQNKDILRTVPCEEYSAPLQLQILGIDMLSLKEPVVDIGCGSNGTLVHYLKEKGYDVCGIDRFAPSASAFIRQDWFDVDFSPEHWGTVIAHHSLSTHFLYCHGHESGNADIYARLYMDVLSSLKPGGSFYYAPGLPFMEQYIPSAGNYAVSTRHIPVPVHNRGMHDISYAARIMRMKN